MPRGVSLTMASMWLSPKGEQIRVARPQYSQTSTKRADVYE